MTQAEAQRNPVERLAEAFLERYRRGERPSITEYVQAHPELAGEIRELFPALVLMEEVGPKSSEPARRGGELVTAGGQALERLGDYRILREVARGGMGVVYEAEQEAMGRHVALKVLPLQPGADSRRLERFRREARAAARLHHTNIVPVFDVGQDQGVHYYAMQFIQGQGLDEVLHELRRLRDERTGGGPKLAPHRTPGPNLTASLADGMLSGQFAAEVLSPEPALASEQPSGAKPTDSTTSLLAGQAAPSHRPSSDYYRSVARVGLQVAEALAYAHGQKLLHRDIKPANLLLDLQGTVWVTDFGLAKDDSDGLTRTGDIVGTLRYMAPERFRGCSDARSDLYSLGTTLYELLTLRPAFDDTDRARLVCQIAHEEPPRPRKLDRHVPRDLETVVLKAIDKEPARRYQTAEGLAEDLRRFLADRPVQARRISALERTWRWCRRNPALAAATTAAAVFLLALTTVAVGAWLWTRGQLVQTQKGLYEARLGQAKASRWSGRVGQRFESLKALKEAAAIARTLPDTDRRLSELRDEAIACLALVDVQLIQEWAGVPPGSRQGAVFDADLAHYARQDARSGDVSICAAGDGQELARLSGTDKVRSPLVRVWDLRLVREQLRELGLDWDAPP